MQSIDSARLCFEFLGTRMHLRLSFLGRCCRFFAWSAALLLLPSAVFGQTTTIPVGMNPTGVAINPLTNKIYVTNGGDASVTVIDGATNETLTIPAGNALGPSL